MRKKRGLGAGKINGPGGRLEPSETDEGAPLGFPIGAIAYPETWEDDRLWLPRVLEGRRFRGRHAFQGDALLDHELDG